MSLSCSTSFHRSSLLNFFSFFLLFFSYTSPTAIPFHLFIRYRHILIPFHDHGSLTKKRTVYCCIYKEQEFQPYFCIIKRAVHCSPFIRSARATHFLFGKLEIAFYPPPLNYYYRHLLLGKRKSLCNSTISYFNCQITRKLCTTVLTE